MNRQTILEDQTVLRDRLAAILGDELVSTYDCNRVWEAWSLGTMRAGDFHETNDRLDEIIDAILPAIEAHKARRIQDLLEVNNRYLQRARDAEAIERENRAGRQTAMHAWAKETFGDIEGCDPVDLLERARRYLEEAMELAQACGLDATTSAKLLTRVYSREPGVPSKELGQAQMTLSILAEVLGESACEREIEEFERVQTKSKAHFEARHRAKMEEGL